MKKLLLYTCVGFLLLACDSNDDPINQNPFLVNPLVNITLNLSLPEYNNLNFDGNSVIIPQQGIRGIVVFRLNASTFTAFDLTDPNHAPNECSRMEVEGVIATCGCNDGNSYDIVNGLHQQPDETLYPMQRYNVTRSGNNLRISN